ncbi:hypothetical protein BH10ACI1_BH10ACI1_31830 [soil metagenome]
MWICQKCNTQNTMEFCMNCGAEANAQVAPDLPPTVIGMMPPTVAANQIQPPNQFQAQNQPNFMPQMPFQPPPPLTAAPKKSKNGIYLIIGGIVGVVVIGALGLLLYVAVIVPYQEGQVNKQTDKREYENQLRADLKAADHIMPESVTSESQTFNRGQVIDKYQLLQASKDLPPELKSEIGNIKDAAAAQYANTSGQKMTLQVFKYNLPMQAKTTCEKIGQELINKKDSFVNHLKIDRKESRPTYCSVSAEGKNGEYVSVTSLYGFLYITTGPKPHTISLGSTVWGRLQ